MKARMAGAAVIAVSLALMLLGCGVTASAARYVDATSTVWFIGHNGTPYRVTVEFIASVNDLPANADASATNFAYLVVSSSTCPHKKCRAATTYQQSLVSNQYDDSNLADLNVHVGSFGRGFAVTWKGTAPGTPLDTTPNAGAAGVDLSSVWAATATVKAFGTTCKDTTAVASRHTHASPSAMSTPVGKTPPFKTGPDLPPGPARCTTPPSR